MGYNAAKKKMKKILTMLLIVLGITTVSKAQQSYIYKVTVTIKVTYEYYDGPELISTQTGNNETQIIDVCASSPQEAREEAMEQCDRMCRGSQHMGKATMGGKECTKYKVRKVYDASPSMQIGKTC